MESDIKYVLTVSYGGKPHIDAEPDLEALYDYLTAAQRNNPAFHILGAQRYVISAIGTVTVTEIRIDFNEDALYIFDKYGTLVDRYISTTPQEPEVMYEYEVERRETWVNRRCHRARTDDAAIKAVEQDVADGTFDVMEGWLEDAETVIISKKPVKEGE